MERRPWLLLGPVFLYVHLRGFRGVVRRMNRVAVGDMRVMLQRKVRWALA
jgi:hypothetical protein